MEQSANERTMFALLVKLIDYFGDGEQLMRLEFKDIYEVYHQDALDVSLIIAWVLKCDIVDSMVETLYLPQVRKLGLQHVRISGHSVHNIIAGCPVLEGLLLKNINCGHDVSIRINSRSLISFGFGFLSRELIIEDAPSLKRLFQLREHFMRNVLVISAPNLEIVGSIYDNNYTKFTFGDTVIQTSNVSGGKNLWRRKYHSRIKYLDIGLKTIVFRNYRGIKSQASFAAFFILNAKMLQVMRFEGGPYKDDTEFIERQHRLLQLDKKASRGAQFQFTTSTCHSDLPHIKHVHDLSKDDPFKCTC
ncbi:hypothetical protein SETIT_4G113400v2 [Setaria italica]|uniref:Uncharacterized protein n=1 Tax=Setaria italica TaxID=4555 RepID=A0A368QT49_SETIT|nr:hypothetical protein SETIT_4G113400v2 [Setaria italica]